MPPSICAAMPSGFTGVPQSIAATTRRTRGMRFSSIDTSATSATYEWNEYHAAKPRALSPGSGFPHPDLSRASSITRRRRSSAGSMDSWNSIGSFPASCASSSIIDCTAKALKEFSTERHQPRGTAESTFAKSRRTFAIGGS